MKRILFIRHAKSDWSNPGLSDYDRPLNSRGKRDAPDMGLRLKKAEIEPDLLLVSPSKRTRQTIAFIIEKADWSSIPIDFDENLYHPSINDFMHCLEKLDEDIECVAFCSHNPGTTFVVEKLSGTSLGNIPTCGIALVEFDAGSWNEVSAGTGQLIHYDYPKNR